MSSYCPMLRTRKLPVILVFLVFATVIPASALSPAAKMKLYRIRNTYEREGLAAQAKTARELLQDDPKNGDAHAILGCAYYVKHDYAAAEKELLKAITLPFEIQFFKRSACNYLYHIYVEQKDWKSALKWALKCFEVENRENVANDICLIYQKLGDLPNARKYHGIQEKLELEERQLRHYAKAVKDPAQRPAALAWLDARLSKKPDDASFLSLRAALYEFDKKYRKALSDFDKLIAHDPSYAHNYMLRAELYKHMGDQKKADADIKEAEDLGLEEVQRVFDMMDSEDPSRVDDVLRKANAALRKNSKDVSALTLRASCYFTKKDNAKALADLDAAVAASPSTPDVYMIRARYLKLMKDDKRAEQDIGKAKQLLLRGRKKREK